MIAVRSAVTADIPRIIKLYEQLSLDGNPGDAAEDENHSGSVKALEQINALPGCELIVAEEDGELLGTMMYMIVPSPAHNGRPWSIVENVVVESERRGTGIGKLMMQYIREKAAEANCYKIQLMSDKRRTEAHKFYKAIGYNATAEGFRLYL